MYIKSLISAIILVIYRKSRSDEDIMVALQDFQFCNSIVKLRDVIHRILLVITVVDFEIPRKKYADNSLL